MRNKTELTSNMLKKNSNRVLLSCQSSCIMMESHLKRLQMRVNLSMLRIFKPFVRRCKRTLITSLTPNCLLRPHIHPQRVSQRLTRHSQLPYRRKWLQARPRRVKAINQLHSKWWWQVKEICSTTQVAKLPALPNSRKASSSKSSCRKTKPRP